MASNAETYILSYFSALDAAERGQRTARDQAHDLRLPESEQAAAASAFLDLTDEIARLKSAHEAFMVTFTGLNPPSAQTVARAVDLAGKLAADIAASKQAVAILTIVTNFVNAWAKLSQGAPAAPAAAVASSGALSLDAKPKRPTKVKPPRASAWLAAQLAGSRG